MYNIVGQWSPHRRLLLSSGSHVPAAPGLRGVVTLDEEHGRPSGSGGHQNGSKRIIHARRDGRPVSTTTGRRISGGRAPQEQVDGQLGGAFAEKRGGTGVGELFAA